MTLKKFRELHLVQQRIKHWSKIAFSRKDDVANGDRRWVEIGLHLESKLMKPILISPTSLLPAVQMSLVSHILARLPDWLSAHKARYSLRHYY